MNANAETVISGNGTQIAVGRTGEGPPVIPIDGAFNDRFTVARPVAVVAADIPL